MAEIIDVETTTTEIATIKDMEAMPLESIVEKAWQDREIDNKKGYLAFPQVDALGEILKANLFALGFIDEEGNALDIVVTKENEKEIKANRATLNKVKDSLDKARIKLKKAEQAEWNQYESTIKEILMSQMELVEAKVKIGIDDFTKEGYAEKEAIFKERWNQKVIKENITFVPYEKVGIKVTSAMTDSKADGKMEDLITQVKMQMDIAREVENSDLVLEQYKDPQSTGFLDLRESMNIIKEKVRIAQEMQARQEEAMRAVEVPPVVETPTVVQTPAPIIKEPVQEPTMTQAVEAIPMIKINLEVVGELETIQLLINHAKELGLELNQIGDARLVSEDDVF